jgi:glycosyltransferase involved in cell wall biosynthesis
MNILFLIKLLFNKFFDFLYFPIKKSSRCIRDGLNYKKYIKEINKYIVTNYNNNKIVYIFQETFFDQTGKIFFSGGAERYMQDLSNILIELGYTVILFQNASYNDSVWYKKYNNINIIGFPLRSLSHFGVVTKFIIPANLHIYSGVFNFGVLLHPNIVISHGIIWDKIDTDVKNNYSLYKQILENADKFVSVDTNTISWFRSSLAKTIYESGKSLIYIPNYVDLNTFHPTNKKNKTSITITFPRRCAVERGYWETVRILADLFELYPEILFQFIGVPCDNKILANIQELHSKFPNNVICKSVDPKLMYEIYQETDITIIPTIYSEGTSLSCLEAMATGNAIIASNVGGLPNLIINKYNGILINPNSQELLKAICLLIENPDLRIKLSNNAISTSHAFSHDIWKSNWINVIS